MATAFTIKVPKIKPRCMALSKGPLKTKVQSNKGDKVYDRKDKSWKNP